ncbi:MAG: hypothetical protein DMC60_11870 [Verrucomicrobia bacterium]|nr:MAG: hypothetical protein DMC60_11870 [Verrucomicrobiota bacterium]
MDVLWYEKLFIQLAYHRNRYGRNSGLRSDKETDAAGQGSAGRPAFRPNRAGYVICRRAVYAANHVRFSWNTINGLAGGAKE